MKNITVVIPALNEEGGIAQTIESIPRAEFARIGYEAHVLIVDGGSRDRTVELAKEAGAEVIVELRRGYGIPLMTGFSRATGDVIAVADADATYPTEELVNLVELLEKEKLDFITTDRFTMMDKGAMSLRNKVGNKILSLTMNVLYGLNINDSESGMWVFRRSILDRLVLKANIPFSREIKIEACHYARCQWKEVPIKYRRRLGEAKHGGWKVGFTNLLFTFKKRIVR